MQTSVNIFQLVASVVIDAVNISNEGYAIRRSLPLTSARWSGNPIHDAFLGVVFSNSFRTSKPILNFSTEMEEDVYASLDFIIDLLHETHQRMSWMRKQSEGHKSIF